MITQSEQVTQMFDSFHRHAAPVTNISIKQQPNDAADAARLHGKIRAGAIKEANSAIIDRLGAHNEFKIVKVASEVNPLHAQIHARAVFNLNGEQYDVRVTEDETLRDEVERRIAGKIMNEIMRQLKRQ